MTKRSYILSHLDHDHYFSNEKIRSLRQQAVFTQQDKQSVNLIKNLSDPTKLRIYLLLRKVKEISVSDITYILKLNQSAVSHALADLKFIGLVEANRCGQLMCYRLTKAHTKNKLLTIINNFLPLRK